MKHIRIALVVWFALTVALAGTATATKPHPDHKVQLCHRTASDTNPYVLIDVDEASLDAHLNNLPGHPPKTNPDGSPRNDYLYTQETPCVTPSESPEPSNPPSEEPSFSPTPSTTPSATPTPGILPTAPPTDV